jgi:hypothetical protein
MGWDDASCFENVVPYYHGVGREGRRDLREGLKSM